MLDPVRRCWANLGARRLLQAVLHAVIAVCCSSAYADGDTSPPWRIVMLYGSDYLLPAVVIHNQALQRTLYAGSRRPIEIYSDAIDAQRFNGPDMEAEFLALLRKKYSGMRVDLVIAGNAFAHDFAQRHRAELWPNVRLLLHNSPDLIVRNRPLEPGDVMVPIRWDFDRTIDLAIRLQPQARQIVVVGGVSDRDRLWVRGIVQAAKRRAPKLDVVELTDRPLAEILDVLGQIPQDSIVYYATMFRDVAGNRYVPRDIAANISQASSAPVYSHFGTYLGRGIVGGALADDDADGRRVGEIILAMLARSPVQPDGMLPAMPATCTVDWREAARWNLSLAGLPPECQIAFRPTSAWETYRGYIVIAIGVAVAQALLVGALVLQLRRRRRAENEVAIRLGELAQGTRLAMLGELTAAISHEVNQPLGAILSNADAAEMLLDAPEPQLDDVRHILADIRRDDLRASRVVRHIRALFTKVPTERKPVALDILIADTLTLIGFEAVRSGITIDAAGARLYVNGDPVQLQQVLLNLLINAMDASRELPAARRLITVRTVVAAAGKVEVSVVDNGPGIPADRVRQVFDSFFTSKPNGIGLGLSLARTIVESHGGSIRVERPATGGARFVVTLPSETRSPIHETMTAPRTTLAAQRAQST